MLEIALFVITLISLLLAFVSLGTCVLLQTRTDKLEQRINNYCNATDAHCQNMTQETARLATLVQEMIRTRAVDATLSRYLATVPIDALPQA